MNDLAATIADLPPQRGLATRIPGFWVLHSAEDAAGDRDLTEPLLCVIARGSKRVMLGDTAFDYDAERYMIASASVPVTAHVRQEPYLSVALRIDRALLSDAIAEMPPADVAGHAAVSSLAVHTLDARIADALSRLVALSQRPGDIAVVAPLIKREISYYLLSGPAGPALRQLASATSQLARIAAAIDMIRRGYAQPLRASDLARAAHMSLAAFYRAFNAVTHMSPLRYQKQLRLQQARRMLIAERADVAGIGATVGYESPSQFSREYRRFFGTPPSAEYQSARSLARQSVEA